MTNLAPTQADSRLTKIQWLICIVACIGFAFDTYELLMTPLVAAPSTLFVGSPLMRNFDPFG